MRRYIIYHIRWQLSALIMFPLMSFLDQYLPLWLNLMIGQCFGACVFWFIDSWIFRTDFGDDSEKSKVKTQERKGDRR